MNNLFRHWGEEKKNIKRFTKFCKNLFNIQYLYIQRHKNNRDKLELEIKKHL